MIESSDSSSDASSLEEELFSYTTGMTSLLVSTASSFDSLLILRFFGFAPLMNIWTLASKLFDFFNCDFSLTSGDSNVPFFASTLDAVGCWLIGDGATLTDNSVSNFLMDAILIAWIVGVLLDCFEYKLRRDDANDRYETSLPRFRMKLELLIERLSFLVPRNDVVSELRDLLLHSLISSSGSISETEEALRT